MPDLVTPWRSVAAAFALNGVLLGCWASRVPAITADFGLDESALGLLLLVMGIGALVSFPVAGKLADRFGAVRVTRWIALVYLVSIALVGLAPAVPTLALALFLFGMCHGAMDVAMNSWGAEVERHMGRSVMSSFHAMWSLGAGLGAAGGFVAASLAAPVSLHFVLAAGLAALLLGPFLRIDWISRTAMGGAGDPVFAFPRGALIVVGLIALGAGLGEGAAVDWSAVFLADVLGAAEAHATLGYAAFSVTMVAMRLCVDRLITGYGPQRVALTSGVLAASGYMLCAVAWTLPVALGSFVLMGMGYAAVIPLAFSRAAADPVVPAGQAIASVATLGYGAMLMGPPAIGFIADASSLRVSFALVGLFALLIAVLSPVLGRARPTTQVG
ncbi:MFS transporter [Jannaschia seohaensis]|uniref:Predicted arabinose efflux permease, MFS family n=1 Tax=Jannaschia seohaensis TaxID=475081 RepID=A0A2Y9AHH0_9RHOB|nr:MFS transporter [Jannaschia seohaensis]PWJ21373.1 putative MFS family arabinose efflux permease [Jannaschia seohaensis]SSA41979.1 Predicted arabinose efflux permease, MFS family [Jannaschia seohaensis]